MADQGVVWAAVVAAIFGAYSLLRNIRHRSVIQARQRWRDALRELVPEFLATKRKSERTRIRSAIVLRLNPYNDCTYECALDLFIKNPSSENASYVAKIFQEYLKHDWERAKIEASLFPWFAGKRAELRVNRQKRKRVSDCQKYCSICAMYSKSIAN